MNAKSKFRRLPVVDVSETVKRAIAVAAVYAFVHCIFLPEAAGFSAFAACVFFGFPLCGFLGYAGFSLLSSFSVDTLLTAVLPAFVLVLLQGVLTRIYGELKHRYYILFILVGKVIAYYGSQGAANLTDAAVSLLFCVVLFFIMTNALKAPLNRGLRSSLSTDEKVCLAVVLAGFYSGVADLQLLGINLATLLSVTACLVVLWIFGLKTALSVGLILGISKTMVTGEGVYLGVYALFILFASVFKETSKVLSAVSVVLCDLLLAYYITVYAGYSYLDILTLILGCTAFLLIPDGFIKNTAELVQSGGRELEGLIVKRNRSKISNKLVKMSGVFSEMDSVFTSMSKGYMTKESAIELFLGDYVERVCKDCENFENCFGGRALKMKESIARLLDAGIEKGKITLIDIPDSLAKKCSKTNLALQVINQYCISYRQYAASMANLDNTRSIIAKQLAGVSKVMYSLSESCGGDLIFNVPLEKVLKDELLNEKINCREAVVFTEGGKPSVTLMVKACDSTDAAIPRIVSRLVGSSMMVAERTDCKRHNYHALHLKPAPKFDVVFGTAACPKGGNTLSGDTHSLINLSEDRFMLALCDGMGSGEKAEKASSGSISLIENFYRAGFDSELILNSVNGLMSSCCEEIFCAIDILVVDLKSARCDFIKLGAVPSFILKQDGVEMVEGNSLPLGILEETSPSTTITSLKSGDMAVLVTDGILDTFGDMEKFKKLLLSIETTNPQELADFILNSALKKSGKPKDDMTVLTVRIFEKA